MSWDGDDPEYCIVQEVQDAGPIDTTKNVPSDNITNAAQANRVTRPLVARMLATPQDNGKHGDREDIEMPHLGNVPTTTPVSKVAASSALRLNWRLAWWQAMEHESRSSRQAKERLTINGRPGADLVHDTTDRSAGPVHCSRWFVTCGYSGASDGRFFR